MPMRPGSTCKGWRVRGAIAWKLVLGIAVAAAVVWVLAQPSVPPPEPGSRAVAGPIAVRTPVPNTERPTAPPPAAAPPAAVVATGSPSDPFAGVDVSNNSVLRHIAGIEEKARGRRAAQARDPLRVNPAATATPPARQPVAPQPPREQPAAESRPVAPPGGVQLVAALGLPDVPRTAATPPTVPLAEVPLARPVTESAAASAPAAERAATPVPASPAANPAPGDRVLVAALGKSAPPQSTTPPLRVARRTVPVFPVEAMRAGIQNGRVVARLTIEADGRVSAAQIINSNPIGYFERESRRALATWRYDPPGQPTSADVELIFTRE